MAGADEFAGTSNGPDDQPNGLDGGAIDPASAAGIGTDGGGIGGDTIGDGDNYVRNADGTVKRNRDGSPRRKRGRKAGNKNPSGNTANLKGSIDALTSMLFVGHTMLAGVTNIRELEIDQEEAKLLANGAVPVLDMFDFAPDPRFVAVFGLLAACGQVYGPRVYLYKMRMQQEKDAAMKPAKVVTPAQATTAASVGLGAKFDEKGNPIL